VSESRTGRNRLPSAPYQHSSHLLVVRSRLERDTRLSRAPLVRAQGKLNRRRGAFLQDSTSLSAEWFPNRKVFIT
jgi:hypothetical protein